MRNIQIILILFLLHYIYSDECGDGFEIIKNQVCFNIEISGKKCYLTSEGCKEHTQYTTCVGDGEGVYKGNNNNICNILAASVNTKKCAVVNGQCTEVLKTCNEMTGINAETCSSLDAGATNKRCYLNGENCESHYKSCSNIANEEECLANRPLKKKEDPSDEDEDSFQNCIWDNGFCKQYEKCEDYEGNNDIICRTIKVFNGDGNEDNEHICKIAGEPESCQKETKSICVDFTGECTGKNTVENNNICIAFENQCKEIPTVCESYTEGKEEICEIISNYLTDKDSKKCELEGNICKTKYRTCSDFDNNVDGCNNFDLSSDLKMCVYIGSKCEEVYKDCSKVNEDTNINKSTACKSALVYNIGNIDYTHKCVYGHATDGATTDTCYSKTINACEDYEYDDEAFCSRITSSDADKYKCALVKGKCIEQYINCEKCNNENDCDQKTCESIVLSEDNKKCVLVSDKACEERTKLCSEYDGNKESECKKYEPNLLYKTSENPVNKKICSIYNGKCIEQYKYCSDYKEKDETFCKSIIPYDTTNGITKLDNAYKCILDNDFGCMRTVRECTEAKNSAQCSAISSAILNKSDNKRKCIYYNGECREEYATCESYATSLASDFVASTCTNIKLEKKCYVDTNNCKTNTTEDCSNYKVESITNQCELIDLGEQKLQKKCIYSSNLCQKVSKTCSEIISNEIISEDICTNAPTSDDNKKKCILTPDKKGCEEIDKSDNSNNQQGGSDNGNNSGSDNGNNSGSDTGGNENNNNNSAGKNIISSLLIIFSLLF